MATQNGASDRTRIDLAVEASIHIGLAILLVTACMLILRPFAPLLTWGIIIAVSAYPSFRQLTAKLGDRVTLRLHGRRARALSQPRGNGE